MNFLDSIKDFLGKAFPDKKSKILGIIILIIILGTGGFFAFQKLKPKKIVVTADALIQNYISTVLDSSNENMKTPSIQKMTADIKTSEGNASLDLENRRDKDTDHLMINFNGNNKKTMEMYADKVDQQVGIYVKRNENLWEFELKPKQSAVDDPRTEFIEVSASGSEIKSNNFKNLILEDTSDKENTYKVSTKVDGRVMLSLLGNNYQSIYINYDSIASYLAKYNESLTINCTLYFDKTNKQLQEIRFIGTQDNFKECNAASTGIQINNLDINLINESYEASNVYVSEDVEKVTKTVTSLQTNRLENSIKQSETETKTNNQSSEILQMDTETDNKN